MFKVLLATDGSEDSLRAAEYVVEMGKRIEDLEVTLLTVIDPNKMPISLALASGTVSEDISPLPGILPRLEQARAVVNELIEKEGLDDLNRTQNKLRTLKRPIARRVLRGRPAEVICQVAENEDFDLVVLGCKGKGCSSGSVLGSVCHEVVQRSRVPVTAVPHPAQAS